MVLKYLILHNSNTQSCKGLCLNGNYILQLNIIIHRYFWWVLLVRCMVNSLQLICIWSLSCLIYIVTLSLQIWIAVITVYVYLCFHLHFHHVACRCYWMCVCVGSCVFMWALFLYRWWVCNDIPACYSFFFMEDLRNFWGIPVRRHSFYITLKFTTNLQGCM